jgi:pimeloyl-ACP methyl ester carboxylesterase
MHDDADCVRAVLDTVDAPVVLVGHSYGGAVITDAGTHDAVHELVYISAFALDVGESVRQNELTGGAGSALEGALGFDGDVITVDPQRAVAALYHDCPDEAARSAVAALRPQSMASFAGIPREIAWRAKPATYAICTDDRAVMPALQRAAARRVTQSVEWPTSHSPFVSRPDLVLDLLVERATSARDTVA